MELGSAAGGHAALARTCPGHVFLVPIDPRTSDGQGYTTYPCPVRLGRLRRDLGVGGRSISRAPEAKHRSHGNLTHPQNGVSPSLSSLAGWQYFGGLVWAA